MAKAAVKVEERQPKVGDWLLYRLTLVQARIVNSSRSTAAHSHEGSDVDSKTVVPILVTAAKGDKLSGQAFLDGNDSIWVQNLSIGDGEGQANWPE